MGPLVGAPEFSKALIEAGNNLFKSHPSTDVILNLLDEIESLLSTVEQDPTVSVQNALIPSMKALISANLLRNPDSDVRVFVVSCLTEIMRITAPDAPYNDDQMKEIFQVTIEAFGKLADASCRSFRKAEAVLDTVSKVRLSLVMLDLACDDLILEMFLQFLKIISPDHPQVVLLAMESIMVTVINESEEVPIDLLEILLTTVKKETQDVSPMALRLVEKVLSRCAYKLQPCIMEALKSTGTSLDMYSPVVLSICQNQAATTQTHGVVNAKENEADEKKSEELVPSYSLEDKLDLGISRKRNRSKRTARGGTHRANVDEKVRNRIDLIQILKQGLSESTDADTESGSTRKRGRKTNSLMNPEEGYSFKTSSSKKVHEKELVDSSLGNLAAKNASLPAKNGQTNQSVVISLSSSSRARTGSHKRNRTRMEEMNHDAGSFSRPASRKQVAKKDSPEEEHFLESNLEKPEAGIKTAKLSKKERAHIGLAKTSAKKPFADNRMVKTSGKTIVHSDAKKKNAESASTDTHIPQSSKSKKNSHITMPLTKEFEQTSKSHPKRKRTAGQEVESNKNESGEELVGKRVNVWWPLDKKFYEGVIDSYSSRKKMHRVSYSDGDAEELNLKKEHWGIIPDNSSDKESDLPESIPLSDLIRRQKAKKSKNVSTNVELSSSPEARSSMRTMKKKDLVANSTKQEKRTKDALKVVSNEPESREGKNLKSLKELNAEPGRTKGRDEKRQRLARAMHRESEKCCDEKEERETKGEDSMKFRNGTNSEHECNSDHKELPEDPNAETKTDGKEVMSTKEPNAEPETDGEEQKAAKEPIAELKTDGEEQKAAKEPIAELKTDGEEHKSVNETNAEPKTDEEEQKSVKEPNAKPETDGEEQKWVKEPSAEPETEVQRESAKEQTADIKIKELKEESDEAEVGTIPVSG